MGDSNATRWWRWPSLSLLLPLLLFLLLRLPSFFEPHWYTDEAGYANTAYLMAHGKVLYLTVLNNKPPLLFWIYQVDLSLFGTGEAGLHLFSFVTGALALGAVWKLLRDGWPGPGVWVGTLAAALLLGTPLLLGDLTLPENLLIAPEAWGVVMVVGALRAQDQRGRLLAAAAAGALLALACLIQQTALGAAVVLVLLLAVLPGRRPLIAAGLMALTGIVVVGIGLTPALLASGPHQVAYYLFFTFGNYTSSSLPLTALSLLPRAAAGVLLLLGAVAARRARPELLVVWAWLAVDLLVYLLPNRPYIFHLLPAAVPAAVVVGAMLPTRRLLPRRQLWLLPVVLSCLLSLGVWAEMFSNSQHQMSLYTVARTAFYYPMFAGRATGRIGQVQYDNYYDDRIVTEESAASWLRAHGLARATAVVWSADSWAYLLTPLRPVLPAPPLYKDIQWLGQTQVTRRTIRADPEVILLVRDGLSQYGFIRTILQSHYRQVAVLARGSIWLRSNAIAVKS